MHWLEATKNNRHVPKIRLGQKTLYKTIEIPIGQFLVRGSIILDTWLTRYRNEEGGRRDSKKCIECQASLWRLERGVKTIRCIINEPSVLSWVSFVSFLIGFCATPHYDESRARPVSLSLYLSLETCDDFSQLR